MTRIFVAVAIIAGYCAAQDRPFPIGDQNRIDLDAVFLRSEIGKSELRIDPAPIEMVESEQIESPESYDVTSQYPNPF